MSHYGIYNSIHYNFYNVQDCLAEYCPLKQETTWVSKYYLLGRAIVRVVAFLNIDMKRPNTMTLFLRKKTENCEV